MCYQIWQGFQKAVRAKVTKGQAVDTGVGGIFVKVGAEDKEGKEGKVGFLPQPDVFGKLKPMGIEAYFTDVKMPQTYEKCFEQIKQNIGGVSSINYAAIAQAVEGDKKEISVSAEQAK